MLQQVHVQFHVELKKKTEKYNSKTLTYLYTKNMRKLLRQRKEDPRKSPIE